MPRLVKNAFLKVDLIYSDSDYHFKYKVNRVWTLGTMWTFLVMIKRLIQFIETRDLRVGPKDLVVITRLVGIFNAL